MYVDTVPDERGRWAEALEWDVWAIDTEGLVLERDPINPGCWFIAGDVPATQVGIHGSYRRW